MKEIVPSKLAEVRELCLIRQENRCAICQKELGDDVTNQHVDHQHCFKSETLGENGAGLIRGVLCRNCNALEGKIWNNANRYGAVNPKDPVGSRIKWLKQLVNYYEDNLSITDPILHPKERRPELLQKSEYNRILKYFKSQKSNYKRNGELKPFPKYTGKWTLKLKELKALMRANEQTEDSDG